MEGKSDHNGSNLPGPSPTGNPTPWEGKDPHWKLEGPWGQMKDPGKPGHLMRCVNQGNRTINPDPPTYHNTHHEAGERGGRGGSNGSNLPLLRKDPQAT